MNSKKAPIDQGSDLGPRVNGESTRPLSRSEVRSLDRRAIETLGIPSLVLMENAGRGAAEYLREVAAANSATAPRITVICGPGNNGGDGAVIARHCDGWRWPVRVLWCVGGDQIRGDAAAQRDILTKSRIAQSHAASPAEIEQLRLALDDADWVVDALFGTGLARPVEGWFRQVIEAINQSRAPTLAIDSPSGLDCDTGIAMGAAIRARATVTFVSRKIGFENPDSRAYTGDVRVVDLGLPNSLLADDRVGS